MPRLNRWGRITQIVVVGALWIALAYGFSHEPAQAQPALGWIYMFLFVFAFAIGTLVGRIVGWLTR